MKIREATAQCDKTKPNNNYDEDIKIEWLSNLDRLIAENIIRKSKAGKDFVFAGYGAATDPDTELLAPPPYDEMYVLYLHAQIDKYNQDYERYGSSLTLFNNLYQAFAGSYIREHKPVMETIDVFGDGKRRDVAYSPLDGGSR
mgnify:FL=1|nr:MAG TPA: hypothetical protein [Caudoviricetes sp.]